MFSKNTKIMSRTFRYFKLVYIVAGILTSNAEVCEHVDKIQIAPRVEVKQMLRPQKVYRGVGKISRSWFSKIDALIFSRIRRRLMPILSLFSIWTIPNYLIDFFTVYISKKFIISTDCDMIYNK